MARVEIEHILTLWNAHVCTSLLSATLEKSTKRSATTRWNTKGLQEIIANLLEELSICLRHLCQPMLSAQLG